MFDHTKAKSLVNDDTNSLISVITVLIGESTQDHIITCIVLCTCNCIFVLLLSIITSDYISDFYKFSFVTYPVSTMAENPMLNL